MKTKVLLGVMFAAYTIASTASAGYPNTNANGTDAHAAYIKSISEALRMEGATTEQIDRIIQRANQLEQMRAGIEGCRGDERCGGGG